MKTKSFFQFIISTVLIFAGCRNGNEEIVRDVLNGDWSIDSLTYKNWELRACLPLNIIHFYDDSISSLPTTTFCDSTEFKDFNFKSIHRIIYKNKSDISLIFETKNKFFQDTFKVQFIDDINNKLMKMELKSNETYVVCTKGSLEGYSKLKREINKVGDIEEINVHYNR